MRNPIKLPNPGDGISANWGRRVAKEILANRIIAGTNIRVTYTPNGTIINSIAPVVAQRASNDIIYPWKVIVDKSDERPRVIVYIPEGSLSLDDRDMTPHSLSESDCNLENADESKPNWFVIPDNGPQEGEDKSTFYVRIVEVEIEQDDTPSPYSESDEDDTDDKGGYTYKLYVEDGRHKAQTTYNTSSGKEKKCSETVIASFALATVSYAEPDDDSSEKKITTNDSSNSSASREQGAEKKSAVPNTVIYQLACGSYFYTSSPYAAKLVYPGDVDDYDKDTTE